MSNRIWLVTVTAACMVQVVDSAKADIAAQTTITCYQGASPAPCPRFGESDATIEIELGASWYEPVVDSIQLLTRVYNAIQAAIQRNIPGAAYESYQAYREALQLSQSTSDKQAVKQTYLRLYLSERTRYDRIDLTFRAVSDDDPFQPMKAAVPPQSYVIKLGRDDPEFRGQTITRPVARVLIQPPSGDRKSVSGTVSLNAQQLPVGVYPVVVSAKEDNCGVCLSAIHVISVSVARECNIQVGSQCTLLSNQWQRLTAQINRDGYQIYQILSTRRPPEGIRNKQCPEGPTGRRYTETQQIYCRNAYWRDEVYQDCPYGLGVSPDECRQIGPLQEAIWRNMAERDNIAQQIIQNRCCNPFVNPGGTEPRAGGNNSIDRTVNPHHTTPAGATNAPLSGRRSQPAHTPASQPSHGPAGHSPQPAGHPAKQHNK